MTDGPSVFARYIDNPKSEWLQQELTLAPAMKLLDWLRHNWPHPTVNVRHICRLGPRSIRARESALKAAETLVRRGWLVPVETRRWVPRANAMGFYGLAEIERDHLGIAALSIQLCRAQRNTISINQIIYKWHSINLASDQSGVLIDSR